MVLSEYNEDLHLIFDLIDFGKLLELNKLLINFFLLINCC